MTHAYTPSGKRKAPIHVLAHVDDLGAVGTRAQVDRFYAEISDKEKGFSITKAGPLGRPGVRSAT